jgi:HAMP domain-containing protein
MLNKTPTIDIEALMYLTYIDNFLVCLGILVVASILFFLNDWLNPNSPEM